MAPSAKVISALVLPNNEGTFAQVIAGMQYVLDPDNNADTDDGADVVNMSLGIPGTYDEFIVPVQNMLKAGVVPVFAIGNFGPTSASTGSPGNLPDAIGVGAVGQDGQVASFSSRGPVNWNSTIKGVFTKPDIAAPGVEITSAFPNGQYGALSGSSQASPIAAGAVALLLSAKPGTSVDGIKNALYTSASNAGSKNNNVGFGQISVPGAMGKLGVNLGGTPRPPRHPPPRPPRPPRLHRPRTHADPGSCADPGARSHRAQRLHAVRPGRQQVRLQRSEGRRVRHRREVPHGRRHRRLQLHGRRVGPRPRPGVRKGCFIKDRPGTPAPTPAPAPTPRPAPARNPPSCSSMTTWARAPT